MVQVLLLLLVCDWARQASTFSISGQWMKDSFGCLVANAWDNGT